MRKNTNNNHQYNAHEEKGIADIENHISGELSGFGKNDFPGMVKLLFYYVIEKLQSRNSRT